MRVAAIIGIAVVLVGCKSNGSGDSDADASEDTSGMDTTGDVSGDASSEDVVLSEVECTIDAECDDFDVCTSSTCSPDGECVTEPLDADEDGYPAETVGTTFCGGTDCDDSRADVHPDASRECDGVDHDCSREPDQDEDGDGYLDEDVCPTTGDDCDDSRADVNPGETPDCANTFDSDCDGVYDCAPASCGGVDCPCTEMEWLCEGGGDEDCDGDADCDDTDCTAPCACGTACTVAETCCNHGCCDIEADTDCCGECGNSCGIDEMCCSGECEQCCHHLDCDDSNNCTVDTCVDGVCSNDSATTDMLACPGGVCCGGTCMTGGNCCRSTDCGCMGMAMPCSSMTVDATCSSQTGCTWDDQSCRFADTMLCNQMTNDQCDRCTNCSSGAGVGGMCGPGGTTCSPSEACSMFTLQEDCESCECTWSGGVCSGTAYCDDIPDMYSWMCWICPACYHAPGYGVCSGGHPPCNTYTVTSCNDEVGCSWLPTCTDNVCVGL